MNKNQQFLLELVKTFLHPNNIINIPININWQKLYRESKQQNIPIIIWETIKKLQEEGHLNFGNDKTTRTDIIRWYGLSNLYYNRYNKYQTSIKHLAYFFFQHGLKMMILKGYGCSLNYPSPEARPCGDIDIWMFGKQKEADKYIQHELNIKINQENDHHSVFHFNNFIVENHGSIQDINIHKSDVYINNLLEQLAAEETTETEIDGIKLLLPSVRFNSIHLLRHMACDFATFTTSLRHVLDWSTFVHKNAQDIDWKFVYEVAHKANMNKFLDAINGICVEYLGYSQDIFPIEEQDVKLRDRVLKDILNNHDTPYLPQKDISFTQKLKYGLFKTSRLWKNRWKYKIVYNETLLQSFCTLASHRMYKI